MNDIRPFKGLRFDERVVGPLGRVLCPPYDVISPDEQAALHEQSPFNAIRLELGLQFPGDDDSSSRYTRAATTLERWLAEGVLKEEQEPALYLYEQRFRHEERTAARRGLLARLRLSPWEEGLVLPHEETLAKPKEDRLHLMRATRCNLSPLFLLFDDPTGTVRDLMDRVADGPPTAEAGTRDRQGHLLWAARGPLQRRLLAALRELRLYVADGHHRYETALAYRDERRADPIPPAARPATGRGEDPAYEFAMVLLVDARDPDLVVLPTHRIVREAPTAALEALDAALPDLFQVERVEANGGAATTAEALLDRMRESGREGPVLGIYRPGPSGPAVLRLRRPADRADGGARPVLDVDVLHELVLAPLLDIRADHLRTGNHVVYTRDAAEAVRVVDRGEASLAFLLNPTRVEHILQTARAGGKMPQKSTYFYPKPATGLVMNPLG